ncbi:MAG: Kelch repeat-containing protein, partial [Chitinophagaceae bacterium]
TTTGKITLITGGQTVVTTNDLRILVPIIISFAPDSVQVNQEVIIEGKYFNPAIANNQVSVNGTAGTVLQTSDTMVRFRVNTGTTTGKITLVTGGQTVTTTNDLRIYVAPWIRKTDYPEDLGGGFGINGLAQSFNSATAGYIYKTKKLWQYNPSTNSWTRKADLPATKFHNNGFCFTIGNKAYIGLGSSGEGGPVSTMSKEVWEYDMPTDVWTRKADFPGSRRSGCFSFSVGSSGYVGGGDTMNGAFNQVKDFWKYDPQTDTWAQLLDYPGNKLTGSLGVSMSTMGYVFEGGYGTLSAPLSSFSQFRIWSFDPQANAWLLRAPLNMAAGKPATSATAFALNGKIYAAIGGTDTTNIGGNLTKKDFWEFDPQANAWTIKPQVPGPVRWFPSSFAINGKGYVGMGSGPGITLRYRDFWQYNP